MSNLFFLHGLNGSSKGTKSQFLKQYFPDCIIPDFGEDMRERINQLTPLVTSPAWLVGSSLGGLQALFFANHFPELVRGMVLMAPAVGFFDDSWCSAADLQKIKSLVIPENIPCTIWQD
jgi:Predicted hydrolases or acyltransferases (alpha/beta hydrolase superfamily)